MTIVIATHNSQVAARCDRVVRLRDGRVAEDVDVRAASDVDATVARLGAPRPGSRVRRVVVAELLHRRGRSLALLLGILVAVTSFTVLTGASRSQRLEVRGEVTRSFRTAYDVLVRPAGARTELERRTGRVQPNFLSGLFGGISRAQYRAIAGVPAWRSPLPSRTSAT